MKKFLTVLTLATACMITSAHAQTKACTSDEALAGLVSYEKAIWSQVDAISDFQGGCNQVALNGGPAYYYCQVLATMSGNVLATYSQVDPKDCKIVDSSGTTVSPLKDTGAAPLKLKGAPEGY